MGSNPRSTVGTVTDANAMLRIVFSRLGQPHIGSPKAYSFNVPSVNGRRRDHGRAGCQEDREEDLQRHRRHVPALRGHGQRDRPRPDPAVRREQVAQRGRAHDPRLQHGRLVRPHLHAAAASSTRTSRSAKYTKKELHDLLYREPTKIKVDGINLTYEGLIPKIQKSMLAKDREAMQPHIRAFVDRAVTFTACPECGGTRLSEGARSSKIKGINIADACAMQISDLAEWVRGLDEPSVAPLLEALQQSLESFVEIGLGYLSLDRPTGTLSGGEAQRTKLIRHLGSSLTDVTYVFDEPTIGLHPHDIQRMNDLLLQLRDKGNTVLVVEHKPEAIDIADHVVDLGPGAGTGGWRGGVRGHRRRAAGQRHADRAAPGRPGLPEAVGADTVGRRWRCAAPTPTTCRTSTSTSRSACWWW